jgi:hypothetical protein
MSTHTRTKHRLARRRVVAGPAPATRESANRRREATDRKDTVVAFVRRTTSASSVPLLVEDQGTIEQIARVLS